MNLPMEAENINLMVEGAKVFGIHLDDKAIEAFSIFLRELMKWNQKINLTALRTEKKLFLSIS